MGFIVRTQPSVHPIQFNLDGKSMRKTEQTFYDVLEQRIADSQSLLAYQLSAASSRVLALAVSETLIMQQAEGVSYATGDT